MFDAKKATKIKKMIKYNDGGFELGCFNFDIVYRNGKENILADSFPRLSCAAMSIDKLMEFHKALCYPGITRMHHYYKTKNIPASLDEICKIINSCRTCAELKPQFFNPNTSPLIKATQPFERISIDFN